MVRLPDIPLQSWRQDQQDQFRKVTDGLLPSLEFEAGALDAQSQIPPDFDAVGGRDQWEQAERQQIEEQLRRDQQAEEERRRQEIEQLTLQYGEEQQRAKQDDELRSQSALEMARSMGIPMPSDAFMDFKDVGNSSTSSGVFGSAPTPNPAAGREPPSDADSFNSFAGGMSQDVFGLPPEQALPRPGTEAPIINPDGSKTTERSITVTEPDLNGGRPTNIPTVWNGRIVSDDEAIENAVRSGRSWDAYDTIDEAVGVAQQRSNDLGAGKIASVGGAALEPPAPDHTSTTGFFDRITDPQRWAEAPRNILDAGKYVIDNFGVGKTIREMEEEWGIREQDAAIRSTEPSFRELATGDLSPEYQSAQPEQAQRYEQIRDERMLNAAGMVGTGGGGGIANEAVNAIKTLIKHGVDDDVVLAMERNLASKSTQTLEEIQKMTRGLPESAPVGSAAPKGEPPVETNPLRGADPLEPPGDILTPPDPVSRARGLTPDEAAQLHLPGFEDAERIGEASSGRTIRGFGTLSDDLGEQAGGISRAAEDFARGAIPESQPLTSEQRVHYASQLLDADPNAVRNILGRAIQVDPVRAGVEQEIMRATSHTMLDLLDEARIGLNKARQATREALDEASGKLELVPQELKIEEARWVNEFASRVIDARVALEGQSRTAQAGSKILNAQKGGYEGALMVSKASQLQEIGGALKQAARSVQRVARTGVVDEEALNDLGEVARKLTGKSNRKVLTEASEGGSGGRGGNGAPGTGATPRAPKPNEETLAERLGRVKREQGRFESMLDDPETPLEPGMRKMIQDQLTLVREEITETLAQAREEAAAAAERMMARTKQPLTSEQMERLVDEAVGRKAINRIKREATQEAKGYNAPEVQAIKLEAETDKALQRALDKKFKEDLRLQESIDRQINRRIDGMLAQEKRAQVREEIKGMAQQAQVWAKRIRNMPDQRPALQEEFDLILGQMREHSNTGERVAKDLSERLQVNLEEDVYKRAFADSRRATTATTDAHIQSIVDRIREVQANARAPDSHLKVAELYQELNDLGGVGMERGRKLFRQANDRGILKSGLNTEGMDLEAVDKILASVDPNDPASMKAVFQLMRQPNWWDVAKEISFINLLSNPLTHAKNISSTLANGFIRLAVKNNFEFVFSGGQTRGQIAAWKGLAPGAKEGSKLFLETMRTGVSPRRLNEAIAKQDYRHVGRELLPTLMEEGLPAPFSPQIAKKMGGYMGVALHGMSTRPLEAMDAWMGHMAYTSAVWEKANQKADRLLRQGGHELDDIMEALPTGATRDDIANHIISNIYDHIDIVKEAGKIEDYLLFRSHGKDPIESTLRRVASWKNPGPDASTGEKMFGTVVDFFMPFYNVPYNFTKQGLQNTVWAPVEAVQGVRALAKGERQEGGEHLAKAAQGAIMMAIPGYLASGDNITGPGPRDPGDRQVWAENHQPNSWRAWPGAPWISYEGTPWAIPFATVAGVKEALDFRKQDSYESMTNKVAAGGSGAVRGAIQGALSQSFVEGTLNNLELVFSPESNANDTARLLASIMSRYSPHIVAAPIPSGMLAFLANVTDTVERDTGRARNFDEVPEVTQNVLESRIPGLREELPEKRGAFGEVIPRDRTKEFLGWKGYGPREGDKIVQQLEHGSIGIPPAPNEISLKTKNGGATLPLTIKEQQEFHRLYGERYYEKLKQYGIGEREMSDKGLELLRSQAREYARLSIVRQIGTEDIRRRLHRDLPVKVAP